MAADIQIGSVHAVGTSSGLGHGFTITVRGRIVDRTPAEAESAREAIEKALADAIEAVAPRT
jgi:hypothetical protein